MRASDASTSLPEESESGAADETTTPESEYNDDCHNGTEADAKHTDETGYFLNMG